MRRTCLLAAVVGNEKDDFLAAVVDNEEDMTSRGHAF